jgi:outer membrane protein assembly factor BamB
MAGPDKKGMVFAFDVDGNPRWSESYGKAWTGSHRGTRTTPTIDGDRLYVMSGHGNLVCFDAKSGSKKWQVDTLKEFSGENIQWGIAESVLIYDDKVICTPGGKDATVVALDKMTGKTIWTTKGLSEKSAYCSPVVIERDGKKMILTMVQKSIALIDPQSGNVILRIPHEGKHEISAVSPIYKDGVIYATTGYGYGGKAYELSADTSSYTEKWSDKNLDCHHGGVILLGNDIIGSNNDGDKANKNKKSWICLDMGSGKMKYWDKLIGKGSLMYADGMLYCYGESGQVGLMKATPSGFELVSSFEITKGEEEHWAHPVVCNGKLYIRHGDVLMVYNVKADG